MANKLIKHSDLEVLQSDSEVMHFGVLGMKWGVRRYQNKDGSLIPQGKKRISKKERQQQEKARKEDEYKQREKASLEKGSKTRRTNPKIAELDKVGRVHKQFYDDTTKEQSLPSIKQIDAALNETYLGFAKDSKNWPNLQKQTNWAKNDTILYNLYDNMLSFQTKSLGGHDLDVEFYTLPDGTVKIMGVAMNG